MIRRPVPKGQEGVALIAAIMVGAILMVLATLMMTISLIETGQSTRQSQLSTASRAAEAGVEDYISKMTQNNAYHVQWVHPNERRRTNPVTGTTTAGGSSWSGGSQWTYAANAPVTWKRLSNGYEYSLRIRPPVPGATGVTIIATGRSTRRPSVQRTYEAVIRTASVLDFQRILEGNGSFAHDAITDGKVYVGGNLSHPGTARANVYVEGTVLAAPTRQNGAQIFNNDPADAYPPIRTEIPTPIDYSRFAVQTPIIRDAAQNGGIYLDATGTNRAWRLQFRANGTVDVQQCNSGAIATAKVDYWSFTRNWTVCAAAVNRPVPANGAIFAEELTIVSGQVNGRITVASNEDIVLEGPLTYVNPLDDTIGMIPAQSFMVSYYIRDRMTSGHLEWWGAILVNNPSRTWGAKTHPATGAGPTGVTSFTHHGSVITPTTGNMSVIPDRTYMYDTNLQFLIPPFFPILDDSYVMDGFREIPTEP